MLKRLALVVSVMCVVLLGMFSESGHAATGDIVTVGAGGLSSPAGVTVDGAGNLYIADSANNRVLMVAAGTGAVSTVGANLNLGLNRPSSVAVDSTGAIYINDRGNHHVLKVAADQLSVSIVQPSVLTHPYNIALDSSDNLYVVSFVGNTVMMVSPDGSVISTVAGNGTSGLPSNGDGGPATFAELNNPTDIALDSTGNLYISENYTNTIRMVTSADTGNIIYTVAGNKSLGYSGDNGLATSASLHLPSGLVVDGNGNLYFADMGNNRVRKVSAVASRGGTITTVAGTGTAGYSGDSIPAITAQLNQPSAVAVDSSANLYIADLGNNRVRKIVDLPIVTSSPAGGQFLAPQTVSLTSDKTATIYYTTDSSNPTTSSPSIPTTGQISVGATTTLKYYAVDASGNQSDQVTLSFVILPGAPGNVTATGGNAQAQVSFSAPSFSAGFPITSYTVTSNPGNISVSGSASPITVTGLTNGTSYSFTVTASNGVNSSPASAASNSVTPYLLALSIGAPSQSVLKQGDSVSYTVTYTGATSVTLAAGNITLNKTGSANGTLAVSGSGTLSRTVTVSNVTGDGSLGISVAAGTATGGTLTAPASAPSTTCAVDSTAPTLAVSTLAGATTTSYNTLSVTGSAHDADGIAGVTLNNVPLTLTGGAFNSALTLSAGANAITLVATDKAGNQTTDTRTINFDPTTPLISFSAATPADGSSTDQPGATVAGTLNKPGSVSVTIGSGSPVVVPTSGSDNSFSVPVTLLAGSNTISVTASDSSAPASHSTVARTVSFDGSVPVLAITDPSQDISTGVNSYLLKGAVSSAFAGSTVQVAVDGVALGSPIVNADGNFQQTVSFGAVQTYHISVTTTDLSSHSTTVQRNIAFNPALANPTLNLGTGSGAKGGTVSVPLTLINANGATVDGVSMDIGFDTTVLGSPTATISAALGAAGFTLVPSNPSPGIFRIVIANPAVATPIGTGVVANVSFGVGSSAAAGTTTLFNTPGATGPDGSALTVSGSNGVVTVITKAGDCDGDGSVSISEVQSAINMYLGLKAVASCVDVNGDNSVGISEVQKTINSFLGL